MFQAFSTVEVTLGLAEGTTSIVDTWDPPRCLPTATSPTTMTTTSARSTTLTILSELDFIFYVSFSRTRCSGICVRLLTFKNKNFPRDVSRPHLCCKHRNSSVSSSSLKWPSASLTCSIFSVLICKLELSCCDHYFFGLLLNTLM